MTTAAWTSLVDTASAPYRQAGRFAWHFARGKLSIDPVFHHLLSQGLIEPEAHVLDIGCGQGLLASLLRAADQWARDGRWPKSWPSAPLGVSVTGIDLMPRDIARASAALGESARFVCGDMRHTDFPAADAVVILDVLHYITVPEQDAVLARVRAALGAGGTLLLRVGDAQSRRRFLISQWVDRVVTFVRGHRVTPQFGRTLAQWTERLRSLGFEVESRPMSQGTPFANVLLVARLSESAVADRQAGRQADGQGFAESGRGFAATGEGATASTDAGRSAQMATVKENT
jgi:SAM-dependent methyltransferase